MFRVLCFLALVTTTFGAVVKNKTDAITTSKLANIEDFPYYAFISYNGSLYCGGAFIERDLVLTAAHCIRGRTLTVYPGITTIRDLKHSKGYEMKSAVPHPEYWKTGNWTYDIGLIKLKEKIELNNKTQLIEMATEAPREDEEVTVVGFGAMKCIGKQHCNENTQQSKHLRSIQTSILAVRRDGLIATLSHGNRSTCDGDSGGPVTYNGKIIAVVSSGEYGYCIGFDLEGAVFTMLDWIKKTKAKI